MREVAPGPVGPNTSEQVRKERLRIVSVRVGPARDTDLARVNVPDDSAHRSAVAKGGNGGDLDAGGSIRVPDDGPGTGRSEPRGGKAHETSQHENPRQRDRAY